MITHEDIQELRRVFDREYVRITDCNDIQECNNKRFANDDKRIDMILLEQKQMRQEQKQIGQENKRELKFNNWLTMTTLGIIITGVITFLFLNFGG